MENYIVYIISIACSIVLYYIYIRPLAVGSCLIDSPACSRIDYKRIQNTVLIHVKSSGHYIWYVGDEILLYNEPTGRICSKPFQSVFVWDLHTSVPIGYRCAKSLEDVQKIYENIPTQSIVIKQTGTFEMVDMVNRLIDENVINL